MQISAVSGNPVYHFKQVILRLITESDDHTESAARRIHEEISPFF